MTTEDTENTERATPETNAAQHEGLLRTNPIPMQVVTANFARKLERERDEAQKELSSIHRWIERNHADGFIDSLTYFQNLERVTDSWYDRLDRLEVDAHRFVRERDGAREQIKELIYIAERAIALAEIDFENDKFGVVSELRDDLAKIKKSK
jgi:hypothetical protein